MTFHFQTCFSFWFYRREQQRWTFLNCIATYRIHVFIDRVARSSELLCRIRRRLFISTIICFCYCSGVMLSIFMRAVRTGYVVLYLSTFISGFWCFETTENSFPNFLFKFFFRSHLPSTIGGFSRWGSWSFGSLSLYSPTVLIWRFLMVTDLVRKCKSFQIPELR